WLLYYGLGSLFPQYPWIRESWMWPYLRQAWPYGVLALTLSFAGYEGEVMRGAFAGVPKGQLEAARAFGMSRFKIFRRIRQDTYLTYEPLLLLALIYMTITGILVLIFSRIEARIPVKIG
ncbi:MAG: ABC transporter permease subunit, partial [Mesorhizobium sp.]